MSDITDARVQRAERHLTASDEQHSGVVADLVRHRREHLLGHRGELGIGAGEC